MHELIPYLGPLVSLAGLLLIAPRWAFRIESAVTSLKDTTARLEASEARTVDRLERLAESHTATAAKLERIVDLEDRIHTLERERRAEH
jgi:hypothetical protein